MYLISYFYFVAADTVPSGYLKNRQIFNDHLENELAAYVSECSKIYHGLSPKDLKQLAYEFAKKNNVNVPDNWTKTESASADWLTGFLKRNKELSIRTPQATSLGRATSFNRHNVNLFFEKLSDLFNRYNFGANDIYNVDETGVTTVQKPAKIIAKKGVKQVGAVTSGERGTLVTMCLAINASGNSVPPMFIFPRKNYREYFVSDGPPGCIGTSNPSGWMTKVEFGVFVKHFTKYVRCSKESPVLLILDNHDSHLSVSVIDFCKENGIVLLTLPPHCSHRLQPLDRSIFGPFKKFVNSQMDGWMKSHPGVTMSIYNIPSVVKEALPLAVTPKNIVSGFRVTGIFPFNRNIFTDEDFLPSSITDRPNPIETIEIQNPGEETLNRPELQTPPHSPTNIAPSPKNIYTAVTHINNNINKINDEQQPSTSRHFCQPSPSKQVFISPIEIRPLPKAEARKTTQQNRRKRHSAILTDTPEKNSLLEQEEMRNKKVDNKGKKKVTKNICGENEKVDKKGKKKLKKIICEEESDDENEECFCLICCEPFSNSKSKEKWVRCIQCKGWAHELCSDGSLLFTCIHCDSD